MAVAKEQVEKAIKALLAFVKSSHDDKKDLLETEDDISLMIAVKRIPDRSLRRTHRILIPHSLHDESTEVCLFTKDPAKAVKDKLQANNIRAVTKVISVGKLKTDYKPFEAKRQLCNSYDFFLADKSVIPMLPSLIGKKFFIQKKHPVPINVNRVDLNKEIRAALDATYLTIAAGSCMAVKIGNTEQPVQHLVENVLAAIEGAVAKLPHKWKGIQNLALKTSTSVSLPIYNSLPDNILEATTETAPATQKSVATTPVSSKSSKASIAAAAVAEATPPTSQLAVKVKTPSTSSKTPLASSKTPVVVVSNKTPSASSKTPLVLTAKSVPSTPAKSTPSKPSPAQTPSKLSKSSPSPPASRKKPSAVSLSHATRSTSSTPSTLHTSSTPRKLSAITLRKSPIATRSAASKAKTPNK